MNRPTSGAVPSSTSSRLALEWSRRLLRHRSIQLAGVGWLLANLLAVIVAQGHLPFNRPLLEGTSFEEQLVAVNLAMLEVLALIGLIIWLTRNRHVPNIIARLPARTDVRGELRVMIGYGVLALSGGILLGQVVGMGSISFHLAGTLFGQHEHNLVTPTQAFIWAGYNAIAYAAIPFAIFRRTSSPDAMLLTSSNRRNDMLVIAVVLVVESLFQVTALNAALFDLDPSQLLLGAPFAFGLYMLGTVLPTMIFVYAILVPRYLAVTRSVPATVILGGLTYAAMHFPDAWMVLTSPGNVTLSAIFLVFTYFGPGMVKAVLTLRTGNAWVHVWAYHALAPHTLIDTPLIVRIFGIR